MPGKGHDVMLENLGDAFGTFSDFLEEFVDSNFSIKRRKRIEIPLISDDATVADKRNALRSVLASIAETNPSSAIDDDDAERLVDFFEKLYAPGGDVPFRHMYSEVCEIMYGFLSGETDDLVEGVPDRAFQLANSLGIVVGKMESRNQGSESCKGARKLLDHVNLELTRMKYMTEQNKAVMKAIRNNRRSAGRYESRLIAMKRENDKRVMQLGEEVESKLKTLQKEYIAILGIFASVIIAFTSGMAFSSSVLQNIDKASIYRLSFVVLIIGMFIFLMVTSLFVFLNRISGISNDKMLQMVKRGATAFLILIAAVILARVFDIASILPLPIPFM